MEHRVRDTTRKLTREEVNAITPREVHAVLGRTMLVDGFDFVRISALLFFFPFPREPRARFFDDFSESISCMCEAATPPHTTP